MISVLCVILGSCARLDFIGFVTSPSDDVDKRFSASMELTSGKPASVLTNHDGQYIFYICTDVHVDKTVRNISRFMEEFRDDADAAFAFVLGDCVDKKGMMPVFAEALNEGLQTDSRPVFLTVGNHDLYFSQWCDFKDVFGPSVYHFEVECGDEKDLFLSLDSANGTLGRRQIEWLRHLLGETRKNYRHCFVFTHTNLFKTDNSQFPSGNFSMDETMALTELFDNNDVQMVFQGHDHYREDLMYRGVRYVVLGAVGDMAQKPEYMRVKVDGGRLGYEWMFL